MGDSFASGEGNPDVPVRFSRERTADYGKRADEGPLTGYPARIGPWKEIGDKEFIEENARWRIRPATARSIRISCARRCSSPSRIRTAP